MQLKYRTLHFLNERTFGNITFKLNITFFGQEKYNRWKIKNSFFQHCFTHFMRLFEKKKKNLKLQLQKLRM